MLTEEEQADVDAILASVRQERELIEGRPAVWLLDRLCDMEPIADNDPRIDEYRALWKAREEALKTYRESLPWKAQYLLGVVDKFEARQERALAQGMMTPESRRYQRLAHQARQRFLIYMYSIR